MVSGCLLQTAQTWANTGVMMNMKRNISVDTICHRVKHKIYLVGIMMPK